MFLKLFFLFMICLLASLSQGCSQVNVKKMTYQALRQHDCRVNESDAFCARSYSVEFHEYERMRQEFLTDKQTGPYRVKLSEKKLDTGRFTQ